MKRSRRECPSVMLGSVSYYFKLESHLEHAKFIIDQLTPPNDVISAHRRNLRSQRIFLLFETEIARIQRRHRRHFVGVQFLVVPDVFVCPVARVCRLRR